MILEEPLRTSRLLLKSLSVNDASGPYLKWLEDPNINQFLEVRHRVPNRDELKAFIHAMNNSADNLLLGIHLADGGHIGNIKLGPIHPIYSRATLGLLIGDQNHWGKGYASEAINALTNYAFEVLNLSAVWAGCYANNVGSYKAFLKVGYSKSGQQAQYWKVGDTFVDNILLVKFHDYETHS